MSWRQYRTIAKGEFIVAGVDTATGLGDYVAAQFLSKTKLDVPLVYHSKNTMTEFTVSLATTLERIYDITGVKPVVAIERNNGGVFELDRLAALNRLDKYIIFVMPQAGNVDNQQTKLLGWSTNTATRPQMLQDLKNGIDNSLIGIYDEATITELFSFIIVTSNSSMKAQAESGAHDDLIMALAIAWQLYQLCDVPTDDATMLDIPDDTQPLNSI